MAEKERYEAVQADINRLLDKAAGKSLGGIPSFMATLLAANMFSINEQSPYAQEAKKPTDTEKGQ